MAEQIPLALGFMPKTTFDQYWPGCNAEVVRQLMATADGGREHGIYLWGPAGLGKSHLLQACCQHAHQSGRPVSYLPMKQLSDLGPGVFEGLENCELVCIDDIDAVAGSDEHEQALFALYNELTDRRGALVVSAGVAPRGLPAHLPDLVSRLSWGLVLRLHPLNDPDIIHAIGLYARRLGIELSPQVSHFLLAHCRRDFNSLRCLLERLDHATLAAKRKLTVPFVKTLLEESA